MNKHILFSFILVSCTSAAFGSSLNSNNSRRPEMVFAPKCFSPILSNHWESTKFVGDNEVVVIYSLNGLRADLK